jgi:xanthine/CO dehydrogenase XdhC/CoxF family maturation factor
VSSEIADVLQAIETLSERGEKMALATVVGVRGSTYRRPGARLLVRDGGELIGNISGGCIDGDVQELAREVMGGGKARLVDFDLTADDEAVWGWGLGCNGAMELFIEPAEKAFEVAGDLRRALEEEREVSVVTVIESSVDGVERGARLLVHPGGNREKTLGNAEVDDAAAAAAAAALSKEHSIKQDLEAAGGVTTVFVEVLVPSPRLLICGAGLDAIPVVRFAAALGWRPVVVDDRERFLTRERFPEADTFISLSRPVDAAEKARPDRRTFVIVMSHNYLRDKDYIHSFLGTDVAYIGSLGPRKRLDSVLTDLAKEGVEPSEEDLEKIYAPAGLDLGAEGPEEVAWSIMAEVLAVRAGRQAGFLRDRKGHIHPRPESSSDPGPGPGSEPAETGTPTPARASVGAA